MFFHVLRTLRAMAIGSTRDAVDPFSTCVTKLYSGFRMTDAFMHVNNSRYLELFEFARWEHGIRSGIGRRFHNGNCFPVVATYHIQYLVPLMPFQFVDVHTKIVGVHVKGLVIEHRILTRGQKKKLICTGVLKAVTMHNGKAVDGMTALKLMGFGNAELTEAMQRENMYFTDVGGEVNPVALEQAKNLGLNLPTASVLHGKLNAADDEWRAVINTERDMLKAATTKSNEDSFETEK